MMSNSSTAHLPTSVDAFERLAASLAWPSQAWINGRWHAPTHSSVIARRSPVDGRDLPPVVACGPAEVDQAVAAARRAHEDGRWRRLPLETRKAVLLSLAQRIEDEALALCAMDCLDMGKAMSSLRGHDAVKAADCFRWYAELIDKVYGGYAPARPDCFSMITYEPLGVIGAITPWNYPLENLAWKLAPALAAGNTVVLKPAEQASHSALRLAELATQAGLPDGVLNVVPGEGPVCGAYLAEHEDVDAVFFTGSTEVGRQLCERAPRRRIKPVGVECGGKSACVIWSDCDDSAAALATVADRIFRNGGQTCNAPSRLIVARTLLPQALDVLGGLAERYRPADARLADTLVGALSSHGHLMRVATHVDAARAAGAVVVTGGQRQDAVPGGAYYAPTVLTGASPEAAISREEVFGPVLCLYAVDSLLQAVRLANSTPYALAAGIYTGRLQQAFDFSRQVRAGNVYINGWGTDDITVPFGGHGDSGNGMKDKGLASFQKCCAVKSVTVSTGQ